MLCWVRFCLQGIESHWLIRSRHEVVGTAVKVGSKVEKGIK